jgi:hypothetical protein
MRVGEVLVDLQSVRELDHGFLILPISFVSLAALEVLMLAYVGVVIATGGESESQRYGGYR